MDIAIPEHKTRDEGVIRIALTFPDDGVQLRPTPGGVEVDLEGCQSNAGLPGEPALPRTTIHVALPEGAWPAKIDVGEQHRIRLTDEPTLVAPVQPLRPGAGTHPEEPTRPNGSEPKPDRPDEVLVEPFPAPAFVPPDPEAYERAMRDGEAARPAGFAQIGLSPVVAIEVRPVRLTDEGHLELVTELEVMVAYGPRPRPDDDDRPAAIEALAELGYVDIDPERVVPLPEQTITSRAQAERLASLAKDLVVNPELVDGWWDRFPILDLPADYLVITDNQTWDAESISPIAPVGGDMVASFRRLAAWKRSRGLTAKVVTITDIVGGRYGDFTRGSRDLQEVIRRFVKWAHQHWGVAWLLLGGDIDVVPARLAAGAVEGHMDTTADDPPGDNRSHWTGSYLKMHVVNPGTWWRGGWQPVLTNPRTGAVIPFDTTGASAGGGTGWYYTTDSTYSTRSTVATDFVRANGPAALLAERLQWLYEWNRIPTDLYYSSLSSWVWATREIRFLFFSFKIPYVYVPPHDWDALDNGIYAQYVNGADADGVIWQTDVSVGRAPVQSAGEADAFVDKVLAYERFRTPNGFSLDGDWPRRLVMVADNWSGSLALGPTGADPPGDDRFHAGTAATMVKLKDRPAGWNLQLIADIADDDRRELPFKPGGGTGRGWQYATSATDPTPPSITINLFFASFTIPLTSRWIEVRGSAVERNPRRYVLDNVAPDGSMVDQEQLREQLRVQHPGWNQVTRYYADETDLTPAQAAAAPVAHLTSDAVRAALEAGPHVVSFSGHGSGGGCCGADGWMARSLTNGRHTFIAYADSCLTSQFDRDDAFGEELLKNPSGGAVAYVGNSRFSWIGVGDDVQRRFFHRLTTTRHLGLANDSRLTALDFGYWHAYARWIMHALNLLGDPEMPIWRQGRRRFPIEIDWPHRLDVPLKVIVKEPKPGEPVEQVVIHVRQGEREWTAHPDRERTASFRLDETGAEEVTVTVSGPDIIPTVEVVSAESPSWTIGSVVSLSHRHEGRSDTRVVLDTADGRKDLIVPGDDADRATVVGALVEAYAAGSEIAVLVLPGSTLGRIERFRFERVSTS